MSRFIPFILVLLCFWSCDFKSKKSSSIIDYLPKDPDLVLRLESVDLIEDTFEANAILKQLPKDEYVLGLKSILQDSTNTYLRNEVIIAFPEIDKEPHRFSVIAKLGPKFFTDNHELTFKTKDNYKYHESIVLGKPFYATVKDSILIGATSLDLLEQNLDEDTTNSNIKTILSTADKERAFSIYSKNENAFSLDLTPKQLQLNKLGSYSVIDADVSQNDIYLNGVLKGIDSTQNLINVFKNQTPQNIEAPKVLPYDVNQFTSITFGDIKLFTENLQLYVKDSIADHVIFTHSTEITHFSKNNNEGAIIHLLDTSLINEISDSTAIETNYRDFKIFKYNKANLISSQFNPLIKYNSANFYAVLDNFLCFGNSVETLQDVITNYQNKTTLSKSYYFNNMMEDLSDESSLFVYQDATALKSSLVDNFPNTSLKLSSYKASGIQYVYDINFAHVNAVIKKHKAKPKANTVSEQLSLKFNKDLLIPPQTVVNHRTKEKEFIVQDIDNMLYLVSNSGKVLWKKQLHGKILGNVEQIDSYKNGRLQLTFATEKRVYVIDRTGKDVGKFPLKFNDKITQPLSVFDYDRKRNYRLLITQNNELLMVDQLGKTIKGFKPDQGNNKAISSQPKHFRIGSKDYIVFAQGDQLRILNRTGKTRINTKETIQFSSNEIYLYKNQFTTTNKNGQLVQVNLKGQVSKQNLNLDTKHHITTTSKTFVALSENKLTIKSKTIELDYGNYTNPEIFYINDKIYIAVTNKQSKQILLFDSQAKLIPNFPVFGKSKIILDNIDQDRFLEVITQGDDNAILIYQIN
ncbi:MAG: hypothetical protein BM564_08050 [Bacteroidetes bacterium MedPE-SWsnd-G2]|nr:MAG: hypothetical protein BM564_08050 [Bacteroidetes bacterium MedPE-SWsnd-G2]